MVRASHEAEPPEIETCKATAIPKGCLRAREREPSSPRT